MSPPALREAIHCLETDGLISVRRGNVGGALVHHPTAERTAHMISMVLQTRSATPVDVSEALMHLEPVCAGMCAARDDRMSEVVPYLQDEIEHSDSAIRRRIAIRAECPSVSRDVGIPVRQRADDPADRIAGADLVGPRVGGVEWARRTGADGGQDQAGRVARPSATARGHPRRQRRQSGPAGPGPPWPWRAATRLRSAPNTPSRRSWCRISIPAWTRRRQRPAPAGKGRLNDRL